MIRDKFDEIHATVPGLAVTEWVPVPGYDTDPLDYNTLVAAEAAGETEWPVVVGGKLVKLAFTALLDGIDPKAAQARRAERLAGIHVEAKGNVYFQTGDGAMMDDHSITLRDNYGQVGQTLTNCTNIVTQQPPGERKQLMEALNGAVQKLIAALPADKKAEAPKVAEDLEMMLKQAKSESPTRRWYDVSAEGLLEAAKWVKDFSTTIGGTVLSLGKTIWPDFRLPGV